MGNIKLWTGFFYESVGHEIPATLFGLKEQPDVLPSIYWRPTLLDWRNMWLISISSSVIEPLVDTNRTVNSTDSFSDVFIVTISLLKINYECILANGMTVAICLWHPTLWQRKKFIQDQSHLSTAVARYSLLRIKLNFSVIRHLNPVVIITLVSSLYHWLKFGQINALQHPVYPINNLHPFWFADSFPL